MMTTQCNKFGTILFDLDGTLTDPKEGITKSVEYALAHFGIEVENLDSLTKFIGPPLMYSFMTYYKMSEADAKTAVAKYREVYSVKGIYQNRLYEGMDALLARLASEGKRLIVATGKPTVYAEQILKDFDIKKYFSFISGAEFNGLRAEKDEIIAYALTESGVKEKSSCIMVGDREFDVKGAAANGIPSVGVLYGFGTREELSSAGATYIAADLSELEAVLTL